MKQPYIATLVAVVLLACPPALRAAGVGAYFTTHYGSYNVKVDESIKLMDSTFGGIRKPAPSRPVILGGGILWDSNLAQDKLFNFRQSIGFDSFMSSQVKLSQVGLFNTFGFSPVRTSLLRFWLGPQLNLQYRWGRDEHDYYAASIYTMAYGPLGILGIKRKYQFVTIGTGLALGLNFNVHKHVTISLEAGMQISTSLWGKGEDMDPIAVSCWGYEGYITVSLLGRFNDEFSSSGETL